MYIYSPTTITQMSEVINYWNKICVGILKKNEHHELQARLLSEQFGVGGL